MPHPQRNTCDLASVGPADGAAILHHRTQIVPSKKTTMLTFAARAVPLILTVAGIVAAPSATAAEKKPPKQAPLLLLEDFESTPAGQIPKNYTKTGALSVVDDVAHSGQHALRMEAAINGPRRITVNDKALMAALGGEHWGRLYYRVKTPTPLPPDGVIHSTLVSGMAESPQFKDQIEVRVLDTILTKTGALSFIYNVQPSKRDEFANGSRGDYKFTDEWTLAEWHVDFATQTYTLFINGMEVPGASMTKGAGNFDQCEIPELFESLSFGWWNYQKAEPGGFTTWIDDIALCKERIGDRGLPPPPPPPKKPKK